MHYHFSMVGKVSVKSQKAAAALAAAAAAAAAVSAPPITTAARITIVVKMMQGGDPDNPPPSMPFSDADKINAVTQGLVAVDVMIQRANCALDLHTALSGLSFVPSDDAVAFVTQPSPFTASPDYLGVLIPSEEPHAYGKDKHKQIAFPFLWNDRQVMDFEGLTRILEQTNGVLFVVVVCPEAAEQALELAVEEAAGAVGGRCTRAHKRSRQDRA
jgi:hypothetical protein